VSYIPPRNHEELRARVEELRKHYAPYLRSLPEPEDVRSRTDLSGRWRWKFEVEDFVQDQRPPAPDWYRSDFDDSDWQQTTVPEWRYGRGEPSHTTPDPKAHYPDSHIIWYRTKFNAVPPPPHRRAFLVFMGATWEAEVWLNGEFLGSHTAFWEPFRFDVTRILQPVNTLAVRLLSGAKLGEPVSGWSILSYALAEETRHERDASRSVVGQHLPFAFKNSCFGSGIGIHREVLLETTGDVFVNRLFVRADPETCEARVRVESDSADAETRKCNIEIEILPENFEGAEYRTSRTVEVPPGRAEHALKVPMPGAKSWQPDDPCMYRCRVRLRDNEGVSGSVIDARDTLFGVRSFRLLLDRDRHPELSVGTFLLNGKPVYIRGTDISPALNTMWYWHQDEKLLNTLLIIKAGGFNAIRPCEFIEFNEVCELQDRLGIMSEQDLVGAGDGYVPPESGGAGNKCVSLKTLAELGVRLTRVFYNHPGVVLMTTGGIETGFDPLIIVEAVLAADPERIIKPISGNMRDWATAYDCPPPDYPSLSPKHWENVVNDFHCYNGWYRRPMVPVSDLCRVYPPGRMVTVSEFGAEALDSYETMQRYPALLQPPPIDAEELWGNAQVQKGDPRLSVGLRGGTPAKLGEYIEASQNYQADALAEQATGYRLSARRIAGQFVFHFIDGLPAEWQKSLVSFDLTPKKAYFALAEINQPVVPLFRVTEQGRALELWVANDLDQSFNDVSLGWSLQVDGRVLLDGVKRSIDVPPLNASLVETLELPADIPAIVVSLSLRNAAGVEISHHEREVYLAVWREPEKHYS